MDDPDDAAAVCTDASHLSMLQIAVQNLGRLLAALTLIDGDAAVAIINLS